MISAGLLPGFSYHPEHLTSLEQADLVAWALDVAVAAPWYTPVMHRTGKPMSVRMSCAGRFGWWSDQDKGYRYVEAHPETRQPWPAIHPLLLKIWHQKGAYAPPPECCLINWYTADSKMGMHVDRDEQDRSAPVVSISLGDEAIFRLGGLERRGATTRLPLKSGDIVILGGAARFAYHGVDRIRFGSSRLIPEGGRINLTLRRVTTPHSHKL